MLTVEEAIRARRSVRNFKPDPVPGELIDKVVEAARLAPSGSNRQPWRFQIVTDPALKQRLSKDGAFGQRHIAQAPVVVVCGAELLVYVKGHKLAPERGDYFGADTEDWDELSKFIPDAHANAAIAVEHMVLMATALGLGSCWVRLIKYGEIARALDWPRHVAVFTLLALGFPDGEMPAARPRLPKERILMPTALQSP